MVMTMHDMSKIREKVKQLLLDQETYRDQRPRYEGNPDGPQDKITRFDQGVREGRIQAYLNALLAAEDPDFLPVDGFDNEQANLRTALLLEARGDQS